MTTKTEEKKDMNTIERMFEAGVHYGYKKSKRHPSTEKFVFGRKENIEIIDLEKTSEALEKAKTFVSGLAESGKALLFVSSKPEAQEAIVRGAEKTGQPYMVGRWIGGTMTNFSQIQKRVEKLHELKRKRESGELEKYTKKEQLLIDREIADLENKFGGIADMEKLPGALFVVDAKEETLAVKEAHMKKIPVVALCNTDVNLRAVDYPIPGNDASRKSISFFVDEIVSAYENGKKRYDEKTKKNEESTVEKKSADKKGDKTEIKRIQRKK